MPPSLAPNPGGGLSTASVTRCALRSRFSFRTRFRQADACGNTAPAGTLVAPGTPGGNSPATPVFAGIVRDKFPGNPSIGQHNPDALCNHAHRQTPDARMLTAIRVPLPSHRRRTAWEIRLPVRQRTPLQPCPSCQEEACQVAPNTAPFGFPGAPTRSHRSRRRRTADNFRTIR